MKTTVKALLKRANITVYSKDIKKIEHHALTVIDGFPHRHAYVVELKSGVQIELLTETTDRNGVFNKDSGFSTLTQIKINYTASAEKNRDAYEQHRIAIDSLE